MVAAVAAQATGVLGLQVFSNGLLLVYLKKLGMGDAATMVCLSLVDIAIIATLPIAYWMDRVGIKRIGSWGLMLATAGFALIPLAASVPGASRRPLVAWAGIIGFAVGTNTFAAGWFSLLSGIVPPALSGRFFGVLRFTWQSTALVFTIACSYFFPADVPVWALQLALGIVALGQVVRIVIYQRIPDRVPRHEHVLSLPAAVRRAVGASPGYLPFCILVFVIASLTAGVPTIAAMLEKRVLSLADDNVILLGGITMAGLLFGYAFGGMTVDRIGHRWIFPACMLGFGIVLCLFPMRSWVPLQSLLLLKALHFAFGATQAVASILITTRMLERAPVIQRSLAMAICLAFLTLGNAASTNIAALVLAIRQGAGTIGFPGGAISNLDAILLLYGISSLVVGIVMALDRRSSNATVAKGDVNPADSAAPAHRHAEGP